MCRKHYNPKDRNFTSLRKGCPFSSSSECAEGSAGGIGSSRGALIALAVKIDKRLFKRTKEQTEKFICLRVEHQSMFTGGRDTVVNGYRFILEKMGIGGRVSHGQAKKKWDNLKTKYKECKCPATGQGTEDGKATAATWPWFALMDEALGQSAAVSPPCLIASIQHDKTGPSTAQEVEEGSEEEEEERERSKDRAGHRGEKRRKEREDPFLELLKEDIKYQREADERREAEARERSNRSFSLLEKLVNK
ncbi:uncharacterized protein LOC116689321 [Etheostoma spectabile]|uniref:uncharacterized protein LOC116689321 n=1 Tax=Etheostoma spectabile TaxID=54343 RepID=UPI0013AFD151|nr:uncharacterized protein LOC116689321 [Etheostoma spectabile]